MIYAQIRSVPGAFEMPYLDDLPPACNLSVTIRRAHKCKIDELGCLIASAIHSSIVHSNCSEAVTVVIVFALVHAY